MDDSKLLKVEIISPERLFYEGEVEFIELSTSEGDIGVYRNHIPMTNVLVPGVVKMHEGENIKEAAVHSGFVVIMPEKITIMAEIAEWPEEIDINRAREAMLRAERRLSTSGHNINKERAELALKRSIARLKLTKSL